jgi:hypothetical protein
LSEIWRWQGKTRGAIGFALNFSLVTFFFQEKESNDKKENITFIAGLNDLSQKGK